MLPALAVLAPVLFRTARGIGFILGSGARGYRLVRLATNLAPSLAVVQSQLRNRTPMSGDAAQFQRDAEVVSAAASPWLSAISGIAGAASGAYTTYATTQAAEKREKLAARERARTEGQRAWNRWVTRLREQNQSAADLRLATAIKSAEQQALMYLPMERAGFLVTPEADPFSYTEYDKKAQRVRTARARKRKNLKIKSLTAENEDLRAELENQAAGYGQQIYNQQAAYEAGMYASPGQVAQSFAGASGSTNPASLGYGWEEVDDPTYFGMGSDDPDDAYPLWDPTDPSTFYDAIADHNPGLIYDTAEAADLVRSGTRVAASGLDHNSTDACEYNAYRPDAGFTRTGEFFRSNLVTARLVPDLGEGVHGQIEMNTSPARVQISTRSGPARARLTLCHEIAHLINGRLKLGHDHSTTHAMGQLLESEAYPALLALDNFNGRAA